MVEWLTAVGILLEVTGLGVTASGIRATWRDNAGGEAFSAPARRALTRTGAWANDHLPKRLRRKPRNIQVVVSDFAGAIGGVTVEMTGWVGLPPDTPIDERVAWLEDQARRAFDNQRRVEVESARVLRELHATVERHDVGFQEVSDRLAETARTLRVEGLRVQAVGLALVALGLLLQVPGQLIR